MSDDDKPTAYESQAIFRIGPGYIDWWMHEFEHYPSTPEQKRVMSQLDTSLKKLLTARDQVQLYRGPLSRVSIFYPASTQTYNQRRSFIHATEAYFDCYYAAVEAFMSVIRLYRNIFGDPPSRSTAKFLTWWRDGQLGLFMDEFWETLEMARNFRAVMTHKASQQPYEEITLTRDDVDLIYMGLMGSPSKTNVIPENAIEMEDKWVLMAPDEDLVASFLLIQLNALMGHIGVNQDPAKVLTCTHVQQPSADDVPSESGYPIFATKSGTFEVFNRVIKAEITVTDSQGNPINADSFNPLSSED